jgi:GlpG protein
MRIGLQVVGTSIPALRSSPSLSRFPAYPVTAVVAAMAIFVTVAVQLGRTSVEPFVMSSLAFESEPWRLASSALPHVNWIHLLFNVIWLWVLGTKVEEVLGHVATLALVFVFAVGSEAAEFGLAHGGVGLSGVGYGLVGMSWILSRRDKRFRDAMDRHVLITFIAWGVLCVLLTVSNVMRVGNIAHASGFVLGALVGYAIAPGPTSQRAAAAVGLVALVSVSLVGAAWLRPHINFATAAGRDDSIRGATALGERKYELAARHLRRSLALDPDDASDWYNYGVALMHVTDPDGLTAIDAWERSRRLAPDDDQVRRAIAGEYHRQATEAHTRGELPAALELYRQSVAVYETAAAYWNMSILQRRLGQSAESESSATRAKALDPSIDHDAGAASGSATP